MLESIFNEVADLHSFFNRTPLVDDIRKMIIKSHSETQLLAELHYQDSIMLLT